MKKSLLREFDLLFDQCQVAFSRSETWQKARELTYGSLTCMGRHTITGMLTASGKQFMDWSSAYRMFSQQRIDVSKLFDVARLGVLQETSSHESIIAHMDDTLLKKTGRHISGTGWRRDPLGPAFHTNFIWGQRFLQISMALAPRQEGVQSRGIPVDFHHCPPAKKPGKRASEQQWEQYKELQKESKLSRQGSLRIAEFRCKLDQQGAFGKQLILGVDNGYTNAQVIKNLPERTTLIGRARKDTKLYTLPDKQKKAGRRRVYGDRLPTPEEIRKSEQYPWKKVTAWVAGKQHKFSVKVVKNVRWRVAGGEHTLQLVVIRALRYRLTKKSRLLYRQPAYLICTDTELDIKQLLQAYLWRWEIEVNFREEKTFMGCGQAQVRNPASAVNVPAFIAAIYALLHIANYRSLKNAEQKTLPRPLWYPQKKEKRITSGDLINNIRAQLWAKAIGMNFSSFVDQQKKTRSRRNDANPFYSAVFYLRN